jgi:hypothetical protein
MCGGLLGRHLMDRVIRGRQGDDDKRMEVGRSDELFRQCGAAPVLRVAPAARPLLRRCGQVPGREHLDPADGEVPVPVDDLTVGEGVRVAYLVVVDGAPHLLPLIRWGIAVEHGAGEVRRQSAGQPRSLDVTPVRVALRLAQRLLHVLGNRSPCVRRDATAEDLPIHPRRQRVRPGQGRLVPIVVFGAQRQRQGARECLPGGSFLLHSVHQEKLPLRM